MKFELPQLPYAADALEPYISKKTIEYHYGKHHQTYINKLNDLLPGSDFEKCDLDTIVKKGHNGIFNNGAQVWNHTFYFSSLSPNGGGKPKGKIAQLIEDNFGTFEKFQEIFTKAATTLFGSGWVWLVQKDDGSLEVLKASNADNPLRNGHKPLLTIDVWEHAYYLDYQNRRPDYIDGFWKLINWDVVESRL
ncbi:superoxide dismutase [Marinilabiliaceae bacterium ANBcel2]|nr:superoxide dismutase [Marinilabiliaceae bacterium ANBcel2]